jgi:hypothetical protein
VIRTHPIDFTGKFVFHCHLAFHEDQGMMLAMQVVKNPNAAQARRGGVVRLGALAMSSPDDGSHRLYARARDGTGGGGAPPSNRSHFPKWICPVRRTPGGYGET